MSDINFFEAVGAVVWPLFPLLVPGIFIIPDRSWKNLLLGGSRAMIWSMGLSTIGAMLVAGAGFPPAAIIPISLALAVSGRWYQQRNKKNQPWHIVLAVLVPVVIVYAIFCIPFLFLHDGLPTGDSQKAIYWGQHILTNGALPDYSLAVRELNRDPVDFYTPGLHALTALVMSVSDIPLTSIGLLSIVVSIGVVWLGASIAKELFDDHPHIVPPLLTALLMLSNFRFLRYLREPGYHWQNVVGEFFLFAMILLGLHLIRKWRWADAAALALCTMSLVVTHQFSSFIAFFIMPPIFICWAIVYRRVIQEYFWHHIAAGIGLMIVGIGAVGGALFLGLQDKIPHLFNFNPHLIGLVPTAASYVSLMGQLWLLGGLAGLLLMLIQARPHQSHYPAVWAFVTSGVILFMLSQGPRFFIDIPPVRALLYTVLPLSVGVAYLTGKAAYALRPGSLPRKAAIVSIMAIIVILAAPSAWSAFANMSHQTRTNSTLTAQQQGLIGELAGKTSGGVLIDDYNRRSASWLLLSGRPTFSRIAADLGQQMAEASQSQRRHDLYLRQLDFEKIYSLASRPELVHLLNKHAINWVAGIDNASNEGFADNEALRASYYADDMTLYEFKAQPPCPADSICKWLLHTATIANDIGDNEDVYEHLPASLRSARLSAPQSDGRKTYRVTSAPVVPVKFNVGDYVRVLWDQDRSGHPDTSLELLVQFAATPPPLSVRLSDEHSYRLDPNNTLTIPAEQISLDEDGFVEIDILNPDQQPLAIDLIALGPARVP